MQLISLSLFVSISLSSLSIFLFSVSMCNSHFQVIDRLACQHSVMASALQSALTDTEVRCRELKQVLANKRSLIDDLLQPASIPEPQKTQHNHADPNCRCGWCLFWTPETRSQSGTPEQPGRATEDTSQRQNLTQQKRDKVCTFWLAGKCTWGSYCNFWHGGVSCKDCCDWVWNGVCPRFDNCGFLHDERKKGKGFVCHMWQNTGICRFGDGCKFAHEAIEETTDFETTLAVSTLQT